LNDKTTALLALAKADSDFTSSSSGGGDVLAALLASLGIDSSPIQHVPSALRAALSLGAQTDAKVWFALGHWLKEHADKFDLSQLYV